MSKLYVFGIGGTGSRVLKALTMLLASGVDCKQETIVPIIIDPDLSAADLTRTVELIKAYSRVHKGLDFSNGTTNKFFKTDLSEQVLGYRLPLNSNTTNLKFKDYMQLGTMSMANQALMKMLFSEKNLDSDMKVGFKGNPNIGSVVLNQFQDSQEFKQFASNFQQGDKIFIISSIFGGTGASGFPLLLKTLRTSKNIANSALINGALIGAISVLPYFGVQQSDKSEIDSSTFISKTKSALSYYDRNISQTNAIDYLYYVADDIRTPYNNNEGGVNQKNNAHFVELWAALSIIDFANNAQKQQQTEHKEFAIVNDVQNVTFADLGPQTKNAIAKSLTQMSLFTRFMKEECMNACDKQPWGKDHKLKSDFMVTDFVNDVRTIQQGYIEWLNEMSENKRSFVPFEWSNDDPLKIVRGVEVKYGLLGLGSKGYTLFNDTLNKMSEKIDAQRSENQRFVELFYNATENIVAEKYKF